MKLFKHLIIAFFLCSHVAAEPLVWENEYVLRQSDEIRAQGNWCAWGIGTQDCLIVYDAGVWKIQPGSTPRLKLAVPNNVTTLTTERKLVKYDRTKDHCRTTYSSKFACSPNYFVKKTQNDPLLPKLWGLENSRALQGWSVAKKTSVVVAVIDTGVSPHGDIANQLWRNPKEHTNGQDDDGNGFVDDVFGVNVITGSGNGFDNNGHGTHVAGTVCATGDNNLGMVGVAWGCKILPVKFLGDSGGGSMFQAVRSVDYVTEMKEREGWGFVVINASWGSRGRSEPLREAIQRAGEANILFVAAAGNEGSDNDAVPHYPSNFGLHNIISVAAIDSKDKLAEFSNYGVGSVDIGAPGVGILSLSHGGNAYRSLSGTSMATPHVAGTAALYGGTLDRPTVLGVRQRILAGVRPLSGLKGKVSQGGALDVYRVLEERLCQCPCKPRLLSRCQRACRNRACRKQCKQNCVRKSE